jgi:hypothetical protein
MRGFEAFRIDPEWQWVAVLDGRIVGQLLAANMHGVLYLMRVTAVAHAPKGWALALFRQVMAEAKAAGLIGYMVLLTDGSKVERRLMSIVQRHGGYLEPVTGVLAAGHLEVNY